MNISDVRDICEHYEAEFLREASIALYTSFKIGGKCNIVKANGISHVEAVLKHCRETALPFRILGKGSNVLVSDKGLDGIVLLLGDSFSHIDVDGETLECQAGAKLSDICKTALAHSLTGFEFAYGIPGTAGGALCMNAGAYDGEMAHVTESCSYIDSESMLRQIPLEAIKLSYRHSIFCENSDWVITKVKIKLKHGDKAEIKARMDEITAARREKQPLEFPSAGSTFKRPDGYFAAKLIDDCGLKGKTIGGAQVSEKHAGFVINKGNATFNDVISLIEFIKAEVLKQTGVKLEREVKVWNS